MPRLKDGSEGRREKVCIRRKRKRERWNKSHTEKGSPGLDGREVKLKGRGKERSKENEGGRGHPSLSLWDVTLQSKRERKADWYFLLQRRAQQYQRLGASGKEKRNDMALRRIRQYASDQIRDI